MTGDKNIHKIIENLLLKIAYTWIGQEINNCDERREDELHRYLVISHIDNAPNQFSYELHLWIGTTVGIKCDKLEPIFDWTAGSNIPLEENSKGFRTRILVSRSANPSIFHYNIYNKISVFPAAYRGIDKFVTNLQLVEELLHDLKQIIQDLPEVP